MCKYSLERNPQGFERTPAIHVRNCRVTLYRVKENMHSEPLSDDGNASRRQARDSVLWTMNLKDYQLSKLVDCGKGSTDPHIGIGGTVFRRRIVHISWRLEKQMNALALQRLGIFLRWREMEFQSKVKVAENKLCNEAFSRLNDVQMIDMSAKQDCGS